MSGATTLPDPVRAWAESVIGPVTSLDDAPLAAWPSPSRAWEVTAGRQGGGDRFWVKLSAAPLAFTRETFAHRHAVSYLGPGRAPRLTATSAQHLALITSTVRGTPLSALTVTGAALEAVRTAAELAHGGGLFAELLTLSTDR
ncbi:hypothetical protein ABZT04_37900 [Streptomyces sp. NPDC005492]|uniref:hypothetical protein n=1 Tax=Streptomyces sp. NPDC005492 TaxID=3156883 RepID=UPI0033B8133A